jgi:transmembrane sensor
MRSRRRGAPMRRIMETISERAARWAVRTDGGALSPEEQRELDTWLAADSRHRGAYVRARAQWVDLDRLAALHGPVGEAAGNPARSSSAQKLVPQPTAASAPQPTAANVSQPTTAALSRRQLLAAGVAAMGVIGGGLSWMIWRQGQGRYTSGIGEVRRIALEDGSTVLLNTASEVTVRFTKQQRDIRLVRGEALFEVAHDRSRPFIVRANDTAVRAVGTAFAVRLEAAQVDVTVTEGVVEVADSKAVAGLGVATTSASRPGVRRVAAHERVVIARARAPDVEPIAPADAERQLAWREGLVSFDGESLQTAVAEINRHNRRQIVVDDPALGAMPIVGVFRATDLDGFSAAAAAALKARAIRDGDLIRLQPPAVQTPK